MQSVFVGRHGGDPRTADRRALEAALGRDGPAESVELGALSVACTPAHGLAAAPVACVIDGRPDTAALARELGLDPATSVREALALGWETLGERAIARLGGEFALLIWDGDGQRGVLACDRLGARPLFFTESAGALLFASEVRNLLDLLPARPAPDEAAVAHWLGRSSDQSGRTLYAGIRRLPAAHVLRLGGLRGRARYWRPVYARPASADPGQAAALVREALAAAVGRSLDGARSPAIMLSGGLDSAAVAALARERTDGGPPPPAYSAVFPGDPLVDESDRVARVRSHLGMPGVEARFRSGSALAAAAEFIRAWDLPSVSPNLFVWLPLLRQAAADGVDVMLDGEGGDELFGCARYLVADRLLTRGPLAALRVARRLPGMGDEPRPRWLVRALTSYGLRAALPYGLHTRLRSARGRATADGTDPWVWKLQRGPRWWAELADALTARPDALGAADQLRREGALAGVELRHPLRDALLVELALSLPPELGFDAHRDRPLMRRSLAADLPPETLANTEKPAFNSLLSAAFGGRDAAALSDLLAQPHPELARRLRAAVIEEANGPGAALDIWRIASLELWLAHQGDPTALDSLVEPAVPSVGVEFWRVDGVSRPLDGGI